MRTLGVRIWNDGNEAKFIPGALKTKTPGEANATGFPGLKFCLLFFSYYFPHAGFGIFTHLFLKLSLVLL